MATSIPIPSKDVKRWVRLSREMTKNILPSTIKIFQHWDYSHIYFYIMKMILLQVFYYVTGITWILDFNLYYTNGQKVYFIAEKIMDRAANRDFLWGIKDQLFTANDIFKLTKSRKLPQSLINTEIFVKKINAIKTLQKIVIGERSRLFDMKWPWGDTHICIDTQNCRKNGVTMRQINKWKFINVLKDAAIKGINLLPIVLLDESIDCGYSVDGLWAFKASHHLNTPNIGIAFRWDEYNGIQTSVIFVSVALMQVHCQLTGLSAAGFFSGWKESKINTFYVGPMNTRPMQQLQSQKNEIKYLKKEMELLKKKLYEKISKEPDTEIYEEKMLQLMDNECEKEEQGAEKVQDIIHKAIAVGVLQSKSMTPKLAKMLKEVNTEHKDNKQNVEHYHNRREVYAQANQIVNNNINNMYANDLNMNLQLPNIFLQNRPPPPSAYLLHYPFQFTNVLPIPVNMGSIPFQQQLVPMQQQLVPMQQQFMASGVNNITPKNGYNNNAVSVKKKEKKTT